MLAYSDNKAGSRDLFIYFFFKYNNTVLLWPCLSRPWSHIKRASNVAFRYKNLQMLSVRKTTTTKLINLNLRGLSCGLINFYNEYVPGQDTWGRTSSRLIHLRSCQGVILASSIHVLQEDHRVLLFWHAVWKHLWVCELKSIVMALVELFKKRSKHVHCMQFKKLHTICITYCLSNKQGWCNFVLKRHFQQVTTSASLVPMLRKCRFQKVSLGCLENGPVHFSCRTYSLLTLFHLADI